MKNRLLAAISAMTATSALTSIIATVGTSGKAIYQSVIPKELTGKLPAVTVQQINGGIAAKISSNPEFYISAHATTQAGALDVTEQVRKIFDRTVITYSGKNYSCTHETGTLTVDEDIYRLVNIVRIKQLKGV